MAGQTTAGWLRGFWLKNPSPASCAAHAHKLMLHEHSRAPIARQVNTYARKHIAPALPWKMYTGALLASGVPVWFSLCLPRKERDYFVIFCSVNCCSVNCLRSVLCARRKPGRFTTN